MQDFESRLHARDLGLFPVPSESTEGDRASLLLVQGAVRERFEPYGYLELGSHLGGMLTPHLLDPRCGRIASIDKRPPRQDDARGRSFAYDGNSTARMIDTLREALPERCLDKLTTIDAEARAVEAVDLPWKADLVMIDAEHTNVAAVSDFLALLTFSHADSVFLFHDANLVFEAIQIVEIVLETMGTGFSTLFLADNVGVVLLGTSRDMADRLAERAQERTGYLQASRRYLREQIAANA